MPWKIEERDGEHCVIKEADGEVEGCHEDHEKAVAQIAALNAAEEKAGDEIEIKEGFDGPLTFAELDAMQEAQEKAANMQQVTHQFQMLVGNVMASDDIEDRGAAVEALAGELSQRMNAVKARPGIVERIKARLRKEPEEQTEKQRELMVYKSGDTYRWAAIYSNNYRDNDNPPEIISKAAHEDFVQAVDVGEWPYPALEWWHVEGMPLGQSDLVFWDKSTNCAWAAGDFASKEIAEAFAGCSAALGVSHGMPTSEIERDESDPTVITRYRSKEISFLPVRVAANPLTGIYSKEADMATKDEKLEELRQTTGLDPETLGAEKKAEAEEQNLESKETTEETPQHVTAEDIAAALSAVMAPVVQKLEELEGEVKALKEAPPEPPSPGENILSLMRDMSVVGKKEAQVDGRKARHEGPVETKAENALFHSGNLLADSVIGPILDGSFARKMQKHTGVSQ